MKVLVLGANGRTGGIVVAEAMANDHEVTVLVRRSGRFYHAAVRVIVGDALDAGDVARAMDGQDAVVECIGGTAPWRYQTLEREVMRNIVAAMKESGGWQAIKENSCDQSVRRSKDRFCNSLKTHTVSC
jgi:uncharacterized protein YbjT (DUF2867 family)